MDHGQHNEHDGRHERTGHDHGEISQQDVGRHRRVAIINGCMAAVALLGSGLNRSGLAYTAEFLHDTADTLIHGSRAYIAAKNIPESSRKYKTFRKMSYLAISGFGLVVAAKSGLDFCEWVSDPQAHDIEPSSQAATIGAFVLAAGNFAGYRVAKGIENDTCNAADAIKHTRLDAATSAVSSVSIALGSRFPVAPIVGGFITGLITSWHFRPTESNLAHVH